MKIQLKRSGVSESGSAKQPTAEQLDYGEIAVNYNSQDPALFLKNSDNSVVKITGTGSIGSFDGDYNSLSNKPTIGNGSINISGGNGITASGNNAKANQTGTTTRTLSAKAGDSTILVDSDGIKVQNANIAPDWGNIQNKPGSSSGAALSSGAYLTGGPYDGSAAKTFNVDATTAATGSKVVARTGDGDIYSRYCHGSYMNMSHSRSTRNSDSTFYSSTDDYIRKNDASGMRSSLNVPTRTGGNASGTWGISISGSAAQVGGVSVGSLLRSDASDVKTSGTLRFNDNIICSFGNSNDGELFCNGSHMYLDLNSGIGNFYIRDGTTTRYTFNDNGSLTCTGNVTAYSDITLKRDIEVISGALDKVSAIRGVTYTRTDLPEEPRQAGVIAQEVEQVLPEVVLTDEEGIKSVAYGNLVGLLVEAVKELKAEIEILKGKN